MYRDTRLPKYDKTDRKRQFGHLLACLGNQSARGRKYDSLTFAPSLGKKAVESGSFGL
jgi:hypothetical protein